MPWWSNREREKEKSPSPTRRTWCSGSNGMMILCCWCCCCWGFIDFDFAFFNLGKAGFGFPEILRRSDNGFLFCCSTFFVLPIVLSTCSIGGGTEGLIEGWTIRINLIRRSGNRRPQKCGDAEDDLHCPYRDNISLITTQTPSRNFSLAGKW